MTIDNSLQFALLLFLSSDFCLGHVELPRTETGPNERNELEVPSLKSFVENYLAEDSLGRLLESILLEQEQWKELSMLQERKIKALETELQQQKQMVQNIGARFSMDEMYPLQQHDTHTQHDGWAKKRADDSKAWEPVVGRVTQQLNQVTAEVQALQNANTLRLQTTGSVYTRWGHASCPNSTETVYSGYVGGSSFDRSGSAANSLCLPHDPVFDEHVVPRYGVADLYGAEYETCDEPGCDMTPACAVCRTPRLSVVMMPATNVCQTGWNLEYSGYLMAGHPTHASASEFICVDRSRGYIEATQGSQNGRLLYYTAVHCASLSCPPFVDGKIVLCAVCSK